LFSFPALSRILGLNDKRATADADALYLVLSNQHCNVFTLLPERKILMVML